MATDDQKNGGGIKLRCQSFTETEMADGRILQQYQFVNTDREGKPLSDDVQSANFTYNRLVAVEDRDKGARCSQTVTLPVDALDGAASAQAATQAGASTTPDSRT